MSKKAKRPGVANPDLAAAMRGLRASSAAQPHDTRPNRERSRQDAKRAAVKRELDN